MFHYYHRCGNINDLLYVMDGITLNILTNDSSINESIFSINPRVIHTIFIHPQYSKLIIPQ